MKVKIAVASTDGKVVNEHFGRAEYFHIFEIEKNNYDYLETRNVKPCCSNEGHTNAAFEKVIEGIKDCVAIVVAKIGDGASLYLEEKGFAIFEAPYFIDGVIKKIIEDELLEPEREGKNGDFV
ncbi:MAG: NifB/NifX family molybdenum-iron cluster-binding protein [Anaerotignum sp.]|nr:NifB/NifX family molybdenum-iron cluster-binding protein [Anaerotignum sp.]